MFRLETSCRRERDDLVRLLESALWDASDGRGMDVSFLDTELLSEEQDASTWLMIAQDKPY
jgi:hypothetical protein